MKKKPVTKKKKSVSPKKSSGLKVKAELVDPTQWRPVGEITHYFDKIGVVVVNLSKGSLCVGDHILIKGKAIEFRQKVASLQVESVDVKVARKGSLVGLKSVQKAVEGCDVFKLKK